MPRLNRTPIRIAFTRTTQAKIESADEYLYQGEPVFATDAGVVYLGVGTQDTNVGPKAGPEKAPLAARIPVRSISADYTAQLYDCVLIVDASGGAVTVTLPSASNAKAQMFVVKRVDSSANAVTVAAQVGETIDGAASVALSTQYERIVIISDGTQWWRID